jgi:hypothetical protein
MRWFALPSVRSWLLRLTIGAFSLAALMGVAALLRPGRFGATEGRVLLTTLAVGVASVLMLCYLAPTSVRTRPVSATGAAAALLGATAALVLIWGYRHGQPPIPLVRAFGLSTVAAMTLAQFSLLLGVAHPRRILTRLIAATIAAGTTLAGFVAAAVLGWEPTDLGARLLGVIAILDVLGTLLSIALGLFGRPAGSLTVTVPPAIAQRLRAEADRTGRPVTDVVDEALARYVGVPVD